MRMHTVSAAIEATSESYQAKHDRLRKWLAVFMILTAAAAMGASRTSSIPYLWIALAAATVLSYAAVVTSRPNVRALWVNLAVVLFAIGATESYFWLQEPFERRMEYSGDFFIGDDILGYKPAAGQSFSHRTSVRHGLLYDVTYTINSDGLRIAFPTETAPALTKPCLVFFGDSFTFGEGVRDEQTMPYQVWKNLGGKYRTVNFGFLGYGPHQMLAAIEQDHVESQGHCRPRYVIYQTIPAHPSRSAGLEFWDRRGPRYTADASGHVRHVGRFDETPPEGALDTLRATHRNLSASWRASLEQSALYRMLLRSHRLVDERDVALYGSIIGAAKDLTETRYPGAQFHVLLWDYENTAKEVEEIQHALARHHVQVTTMSRILPNFPADRARYEIHPNDRHPNALAHALIANYVAQHLVKSSL